MFRRPVLCLMIVSMLIFSGCFIAGRIVDENGVGVAGVTITLSGDQTRMTTTNSDGNYRFGELLNLDIIPAGNYSVTPSKSGYSFTPASINVTVAGQSVGDLEDIPGPDIDVSFTAERFNNLVETSYGTVKGFEDEAGTWLWKAVPFAKPPVGDLRWKAPSDPEPWDGIREEADFCQPCTQYDPVMAPLNPDSLPIGGEDCLYLNIWRPQANKTNLPVYVWIHGGGNSVGHAASNEGSYFGANFSERTEMVYVSVHYRLGPLGWFSHPSVQTGNEQDDSGNYAILDLVKSLEWIQENITAFGGDPDNVILSGESAGGANILSLLISPPAEGLFHKAIVQSGVRGTSTVAEGEAAANTAILRMLVSDGQAADETEAEAVLDGMSGDDLADYLRSKTSAEIVAAYAGDTKGMFSLPTMFTDGTVVPETGFDTLETGTYPNKVPVILGSTKEETKLFLSRDPGLVGDDELFQIVTAYSSDFWKANGVDEVALALSSHADQPAVYVYRFDWGTVDEDGLSVLPDLWATKLGACHSMDIPFFLANDTGPLSILSKFYQEGAYTDNNRLSRETLTDAVAAYEEAFARTGDPNGAGAELPLWTPWSNNLEVSKCILLDADIDGNLRIQMATIGPLTIQVVEEAMAQNVPEPMYTRAQPYLLGWK